MGNSFSGTIPSELGNLQLVAYLRLAINSLSGTIPTQMGRLTSLTELYLQANSLSGSLPTELSLLTSLTNFQVNLNAGLCGPQISVGTTVGYWHGGQATGTTGVRTFEFVFLTSGWSRG